jgi:antitoxin PrlF
MKMESTLTVKGQTTIPREVREYLGINPGDRLGYVLENGEVKLVPRNKRLVDLLGFLGPPPAGAKTIEEIKDGIAEAAAEAGTRAIR